MWIRHNKALYNSNDISKIEVIQTKIRATFSDGTQEIIGEFRTMDETNDIFNSIGRALLFVDQEHPGIIIKDTKQKRGKKSE